MQVLAETVLRVEGQRQRGSVAAEIVGDLVQCATAEADEAAQATAGDQRDSWRLRRHERRAE